jgi:integrase
LIHPNREGTLFGLEFSPDGKRLIAGDTSHGTIVVWDVATGKELTTIETGINRRRSLQLSLSPDRQTLFVPLRGPEGGSGAAGRQAFAALAGGWRDGKGFDNVKRKGKVRSRRVIVPTEARHALDRYLKARDKLPPEERVKFSAHVLRHTFLRKLARKKGVELAMEAAGHCSSQYNWRYIKPSQEEKAAAVEGLF